MGELFPYFSPPFFGIFWGDYSAVGKVAMVWSGFSILFHQHFRIPPFFAARATENRKKFRKGKGSTPRYITR